MDNDNRSATSDKVADSSSDNNNAENEDDDNDAGVLEQHLQERLELDRYNTL